MSRVEFDDAELARLAELVAERLDGHGPEPWVGVRQAAAHLDCQPQHIYNRVSERKIPYRKDGSRLLFRLSELDRSLDGRA